MSKKTKWILGSLIVIIGLVYFVLVPIAKSQTKAHSPETSASYTKNGYQLEVNYSSPSKKERVIFGELVPYGQVWRTGANEPTTFSTKTDLTINTKKLPKGTYSLWTIPNKDKWTVIFNSEIPGWGVTLISGGKTTTRDESNDVLKINIPSQATTTTIEKFTINFEGEQPNLNLSWDTTKISIPLKN